MMSDESQDRSGRDVASALASRRPARSSELETRLWAAAARPVRPSWIVPVALAAAVAAVAVVVIAMRGERTTPAAEPPDLVAAPTPSPTQEAPAGGPLTPSADVADLLAPYQAVLDGDTQNLGLEPAQLARLRDLADDLAKQRATQDAQKAIAMIELRRELDRVDIDPAKAGALSDRVASVDAAVRKAELIARIAARSVLTVKQRALLGRGPTLGKYPSSTPTGRATLQILSTPPGASAKIDGTLVGATPLELTIVPGAHAVQLELPGYRSSMLEATVKPGERRELVATLQRNATSRSTSTSTSTTTGSGTLKINSKPPTHVSIDGRDVGITPLSIKLAAGAHRVVLEHDGKRRISTVTVADGQNKNYIVDLSDEDVIDPFSKRN
jgi:hypothetical protein